MFVFGLTVYGDEITLKNGLTLRGTALQLGGITPGTSKQNNADPVPSTPFWMVDDGMRRYFFFRRNLQSVEPVADLGAIVSFQMKQEKRGRAGGFPVIGAMNNVQPFDEFGRRTVMMPTQKGMVPVIQAITEIRPDYCTIESLTHQWDYNVDTRTIPDHVLRSIIEKSSNREDPAERKAAVQFYVQAQFYEQAQTELQQITQRFPDLKDWCEEYQRRLDELIARRAMNEIERRQQAGQHNLAMFFAKQIPAERVSADISRRAEDVLGEYDQALADRDKVIMLLDLLQAELPLEQAQRLTSIRATVVNELRFEVMNRLEPFLRAADDETMPAAEKLALAYSGWLLGDAHAVVNLDEAIRLWDARFQILEYLRNENDPVRDGEILATLADLESMSVERASLMLPNLPLPHDVSVPEPGQVAEFECTLSSPEMIGKYSLILPPEYDPAHRYPLLVVLRGGGISYANTAQIWAGTPENPGWAQRRGYIVIAPHYSNETAQQYLFSASEHDVVYQSIDHVRKRFRVDSDRIFVAGHGSGADACVDIAMSRPGMFAGAIPVGASCGPFARVYWDNSANMAWYFTAGEKDRFLLEQNSTVLNNMLRHGQNVVYCEYKNRGFEMFNEEQERIFDWMRSQRRTSLKEATKWEAGVLRKTDRWFYWMEVGAIADQFFPPIILEGPAANIPRQRRYEGTIAPGGAVNIKHSGSKTSIWLAPEFFDFTKKCQVRVNQKILHNDFVKPTLEAMLSDVRRRGDREQLFWARLDL